MSDREQCFHFTLGAVYIVRTQPGGRGGQAIVINFITVKGGGGVKKGRKLAYVLCTQPLGGFLSLEKNP